MTEADKLPTFTASSSVKRSYYGDSSLKNQEVDTYTAGLDASWEIDIFGRARRSVEASFAFMQSTEEAMHDVMISLLAELATNYINIRSLQHRVEITEEDIRIKQILYDIAERKFRSGLSDVLEAKAALYNLEYVKTEIYDLKTALEKAFNRLAVLTGQKPGALHDMVSIKTSIPPISLNIVSGIPADMVRRRPDVREAERNLAAQTARIGVAEADKYPKFTLSGSVGYQADSGSSLFNASNSTLSFGPNFSWAVFDLGAVKQNIKVQTEKQKEYLAKYESAVLTAMEDVENAMTAFDHEYSKNIQLKKAYDIAEETYNLALKKYEAGLSDYTDVITAETAYINYKSEFIQSTANANIDIISLYKALGGGWESFKIQEQQ
jgi:NodT family efflux transporter outer membrane factor (OMF) lipoprotein